MFDSLKRLMFWKASGPAWRTVSGWANGQKFGFKRDHGDTGFLIDGVSQDRSWRLEWGPSQRHYIEGRELRIRMELGLAQNTQLLVLSQPLLETLERQTFERYTETLQTVIDHNTPEEMRWLAMFSKIGYKAGNSVRTRFSLIGSVSLEASSWLEGALASALEKASETWLRDQPPFMLMVLRGRLYLRMQLIEPELSVITQAIALFETAALQALRTAGIASSDNEGWDSTSSTAWQMQLGPEDGKVRSDR